MNKRNHISYRRLNDKIIRKDYNIDFNRFEKRVKKGVDLTFFH